MKKILGLIFILSVSQNIFCQPTIQWDRTIGGNLSDILTTIKQTSDGGYILGGWSNSNISGDKTENNIGITDYWVVKLSSSGIVQWENTLGGDSGDFFNSLDQTLDGGYILAGWSRSNISGDKTENCRGDYDYWVIKLDSGGGIQWDKTIGGNAEDKLFSICHTTDGGCILGGYSNSNISGDKTENSKGGSDYWVVKLNSSGNIQWQKTIGGNANDDLIFINQTAVSGYIIGGGSGSNIFGDKTDTCRGGWDYWIVKMDSLGNIQWDKTIGGSNDEGFASIVQTTDGGYITGGWSLSNISGDKIENLCSNGQSDYWIVKLDSMGNIAWQNDIGSNSDDYGYSVLQTANGEYIVAGYSNGLISCDKTENPVLLATDDYWVLKLDTAGNILWDMTLGGDDADLLSTVALSADGGCILGGTSYSNISGDKTENNNGAVDYWVVKLSPYVSIEEVNNFSAFNIFPNPATDELVVRSSELADKKIEHIEIYDALGQKVFSQWPKANSQQLTINVSSWSNGMYFVKLKSGDRISAQKLVVQH